MFPPTPNEKRLVGRKTSATLCFLTDIDKLQKLHSVLPGELFPSYVLEYISEDARLEDGTMCFHSASEFGAKSKSYSEEEIRTIRRRKSIFSNNEFKRGPRPSARHHLKIYYNSYGEPNRMLAKPAVGARTR